MIGYFPEAYPDELFYSICARFSDKMQYPTKKALTLELFGMETTQAVIDLPIHLEKFLTVLPPGHHYTIDRLINDHTLFPFYRPFLPADFQQRLRYCMQKGTYNVILTLIRGTAYSHLSALGCLRFCPQCVERDRQLFGECYWHRVHQLSCVRICPTHQNPLRESGVRTSGRLYGCEFISAEKAVRENCSDLKIPEAFYQHFHALALDAAFLLDHPQFSYDSDCLNTQYHTVLFQQGLATYRKRIYREAFLRRFHDCYSQDFLQLIHCEIGGNAHDNWLRRAVRPSGAGTFPLHHLLLIQFMGYDAETFFRLQIPRSPFGDGPWPCLNPASDHYKQEHVRTCQWYQTTSSDRGKPTGLFSCECGFVYLRKGPDRTPDDQFRFSKVKAYGPVWESALRELWNDSTVSLNEIARRLQVSQITAVREASRIGLSSARPGGKPWNLSAPPRKPSTPKVRHTPEECRQSWLQLMEKMPEAGTQVLSQSLPGVYVWLLRNDAEWLNAHKPLSRRTLPSVRPIDWESKDRELAEAVKAAAHRLKHTNERPIQLTLSALKRAIGHPTTLHRHSEKLPLTKQALVSVVETDEDFAIRRIFWVVQSYQEDNIRPTRKEFAQRVYSSGKMAKWPRVKEAIDMAWASLSSMRDGDHG